MRENFLARIKHIAFTGGKIALDLIQDSSPYLKDDNSVLTKADMEISRLACDVINDLIATSDHILIDDAISKSKYSDDKEFIKWFEIVLCHDFAHAECDWTNNDYSKLYNWITTLAEYSWENYWIDDCGDLYSNEEYKTCKNIFFQRASRYYIKVFKKDSSSVNQSNETSDFLSDCMYDLV